ncbi:MAG: hybrid sensor histidine kinase/response regulator [Anaerolineaceae bacterium]|nr:hybrid sensor histidine kinase/response regulator [Anaerolineaceae bacterium]
MNNPHNVYPNADIMIVDDTLPNLQVLSEMLTERGYEVRGVSDGHMALTAIRAELPDLILLDVQMPNMNGYEVCRQLKDDELTRDVPVIFISALDDVFDKVRGFDVGGVDYITKPFQIEEVLARVESHLALYRLQKRLQQALIREMEVNEIRSRFLSMASHDLRNPLAVILTTTDLLSRYADKMSEEKKNINFDKIRAQVQIMVDMLDDVLTVGKVDVGKVTFTPEVFDLEAFCQILIEEVSIVIDKAQKVIFTCTGECSRVMMDKGLIRHIVSNLLSNAVKYSPRNEPVTLDVVCDGHKAVFRIQDQGIGIPEDDQQHLFETFYRAANVGRIAGTGLGLSIVKQSVDIHGGSIEFESAEGIGTTFTITIPYR